MLLHKVPPSQSSSFPSFASRFSGLLPFFPFVVAVVVVVAAHDISSVAIWLLPVAFVSRLLRWLLLLICLFSFTDKGGMGATKGNRRNWLPQERAKMSPMGKLLLLLLGETESFHAGVIGAVCFFFFAPGISLGNVSRMPVILFPDAFIAVARDERKSHELLLIIIILLLLQKAMRFFSIPQLQNVLDVGWSRGPSCFLFSFYQEAAGWAAHTAVRRNLSPVLFFYPLQFAFAVAAAWRVFIQEAGPVRSCDWWDKTAAEAKTAATLWRYIWAGSQTLDWRRNVSLLLAPHICI